jgi:hypothetical protein
VIRPAIGLGKFCARRAGVVVVLSVVDEVLPGEEAAFGPARRQGLGHDRRDTCAFAREDLVAAEVSAIGQGQLNQMRTFCPSHIRNLERPPSQKLIPVSEHDSRPQSRGKGCDCRAAEGSNRARSVLLSHGSGKVAVTWNRAAVSTRPG